MSARDELRVRALDPDTDWYDGDFTIDNLLDAYRDEVLREAAAKQRQALANYDAWRGGVLAYPREVEEWVIDPIDPDKAQP